jgi:hypothetical protein
VHGRPQRRQLLHHRIPAHHRTKILTWTP